MATYGHTFTSGDTVTPTKLNNARTVSDIVNADISATAAIAATKLASDSITNTQIKSDAAIAGTKIAPDFGSQDVKTTGRSLVGISSARTNVTEVNSPQVQVEGTDYNTSSALIARNSANNVGTHLVLAKSRSATALGNTAVQSGDTLGNIQWQGADGANLVIAAQISSQVDGTPGTNDMPGRLIFSTTADGSSSPTERMRITAGGDILFANPPDNFPSNNTSGFGIAIQAGGSGRMSMVCDNDVALNVGRHSGTGNVAQWYYNGNIVGSVSLAASTTSYNTSSDYRLKENPTPLIGGLETIDQLQPCEFTWKSDGSIGRGFIAHELQAVVPEAVTGEKDAVDADGNPEYQGVDAAKLVPYLVSAVKELKARVEALESA